MTYSSLAALAQDSDFHNRVAACAAEQETQAAADLGGKHPTLWADQNIWQVSASPGFSAAYQYALDVGVVRPGADPSVITDAQILSAVQALLPMGAT